jgi:hypothetical protein
LRAYGPASMSGLLRRIRSRRAAAPADRPDAEPVRSDPDGAPDPPVGEDAAVPTDLPAGLDPADLEARSVRRRRGALRRRARFLRRVRELLLRDLGGLVYEIQRATGDADARARHERLVRTKVERLARLDAELYEIDERLGDVRGEVVLREPGLGGTCPACGELYGSEARFCSACGNPVAPGAVRPAPVYGPDEPSTPRRGLRRLVPRRRRAAAPPAEPETPPPGDGGEGAHEAPTQAERAPDPHGDGNGAAAGDRLWLADERAAAPSDRHRAS